MLIVRAAAVLAVTLVGAAPNPATDAEWKHSASGVDAPIGHESNVEPEAVQFRSRSVGLPFDGHLVGGRALEESAFLRFQANTPPDQRYGTDEMRALLERAAHRIQLTDPGAPLLVGDLSRKGGGYLAPHRSHRNGRDADIAFYAIHVKGQSAKLDRFVRFRRDGTARLRSQTYFFDDKRNWELVRSLLDDATTEVSYIFISTHLRTRLLAEAIRRGEPGWLIERARGVMQARGGAHDDHLHIRIACATDDVGCRG